MKKDQQIVSYKYDLEERTFKLAQNVIKFLKHLPKSITNIEIIKQLVRSATSVGANYIEANESLGKKDFILHIRICLKEAKESIYWLKLLEFHIKEDEIKNQEFIDEFLQLIKIFHTIVKKNK